MSVKGSSLSLQNVSALTLLWDILLYFTSCSHILYRCDQFWRFTAMCAEVSSHNVFQLITLPTLSEKLKLWSSLLHFSSIPFSLYLICLISEYPSRHFVSK